LSTRTGNDEPTIHGIGTATKGKVKQEHTALKDITHQPVKHAQADIYALKVKMEDILTVVNMRT
jgi:hypothetical protein